MLPSKFVPTEFKGWESKGRQGGVGVVEAAGRAEGSGGGGRTHMLLASNI